MKAHQKHTPALSPASLAKHCKTLHTGRVLIVGDIMLDEYLYGTAERISPEAPVPIVLVSDENAVLGGAGNVAKNICSLGGRAVLVSCRGNDSAGTAVHAMLEETGSIADFIITAERPTTVKTRVLAAGQQMLRIDKEVPQPVHGEHTRQLLQKVALHLPQIQAIVLSDYGKGVITAGFMQGLHALVAEQKRPIPILVDPKPQHMPLYAGVTLLTPNKKEAAALAGKRTETRDEIFATGKALMQQLKCPQLVITLGPEGMAVFSDENTVHHIPTTAQSVFDVTGAGDTVIATLSLGLAAGYSLIESCIIANYAAGIVVGHVGAETATVQGIAHALTALPFTPPQAWE